MVSTPACGAYLRRLRRSGLGTTSSRQRRSPADRPAREPLHVLVSPHPSSDKNPYISSLYEGLQRHGVVARPYRVKGALRQRAAVLHIHWPEIFANVGSRLACVTKMASLFVTALRLRMAGGRVVWTLHNTVPHKQTHPLLSKLFFAWFTRRVDGIVSLSEWAVEEIHHRYPHTASKPFFVIAHGHYRDVYPRGDAVGARHHLAIPDRAFVFLFFGRVQEYKGVEDLIRAFRELDGGDLILLLAGEAQDASYERKLTAASHDDGRIRLHLRHVPDSKVHEFFQVADLVVLPFARHITHSGTAMLALSMDRPVLLPRAGALEELARSAGGDWVKLYEPPLSSAALAEAAVWARTASRAARPDLSWAEWDEIAVKTARAYTSLLGRGHVV
jgi:beta-1,4-mannosyltransferase